MRRRWKLALWLIPSTVLALSLAGVWEITQHISSAGTEWTALGVVLGSATLLAALLGLPLAIAQLSIVERDLSRLLPVPANHYQSLRGMLEQCHERINRQVPISFGDAVGGLQLNQRAFRAHFPELTDPVDDWNAAVARLQNALDAFDAAAVKAADDCGVSDPPFQRAAIIENLQLRPAPSLHLAVENWEPNPVTPHGNGTVAFAGITTTIQDVARDASDDSVLKAAAPLIKLCDKVRALPEVGRVAAEQDALTRRIQPLKEQIILTASAENIVLNPTCPICQRNS